MRKKPQVPTTMQERWDLLDLVAEMLTTDFGPKDPEEHFDPFNPADIARHGMTELATAYLKFAEVEKIADEILTDKCKPASHNDNLELDGLYW